MAGNFSHHLKITKPGFGLALLLVFVSSTILIGTSLSLLLAPSLAGVVGDTAANGSFSRQIASAGLQAAQNDILLQQGKGVAITTTYRYPTSGVITFNVPTYPGSGVKSALGNYYVTVTQARGCTYILKIVTTIGDVTTEEFRLVQLNKPSFNPYAVYALRKVVSGYLGSAVRVRCASGTQDIGFDGNGDLDLVALRGCQGDTALPLDLATGEKLAYGLRKLSSAYAGYAIRVRRAADNAISDIGFDSKGNLDTSALMAFVGTDTGYVSIWYDQSGSGKNAIQNNTASQPVIVQSGVLVRSNNSPAIGFDGINDYLANTTLGSTISGAHIIAFTVAQQDRTATSGLYDRYVALHKSNSSGLEDWQVSGGLEVLAVDEAATALLTQTISKAVAGINLLNVGNAFQATSYHDASNNLRLYVGGSLVNQNTNVSASFSPNQLYLGSGASDTGLTHDYLQGKISEVLIFNPTSVWTGSERGNIEKNQGHYFNVTGLRDGFVTTWYDQSGNGYDLVQSTAASQPVIDVTGSRPAVFMDMTGCTGSVPNTCDWLEKTGLSYSLSPMTLTTFAVGQHRSSADGTGDKVLVSLYKTGATNDWSDTQSFVPLYRANTTRLGIIKNSSLTYTGLTYDQDFQATTISDGVSNSIRKYQTGSGLLTGNVNKSATLLLNNIRVGGGNTGSSNGIWDGRINEVVLFDKTMSSIEYQKFETEQRAYYGL